MFLPRASRPLLGPSSPYLMQLECEGDNLLKPTTQVKKERSWNFTPCSLHSIPVAARSKARVYGRLIAVIVGSNPAEGMNVSLLRVLCVVR